MFKLIFFTIPFLLVTSCAREVDMIPRVTDGKIIHIENFSSKFVKARNIDIWMPSDYSNSKKYSVVYMHDGQTLFDPSLSWLNKEWKVDEMMSKLSREGRIKNSIVVGISNSEEGRVDDYFPEKVYNSLSEDYKKQLRINLDRNTYTQPMMRNIKSDQYLRFIVEELKPFIDENYFTFTDKENTFIMGSSYGGLISMYAISEYPDIFGGAACLSTHWIGTFEDNPTIAQAFIKYFSNNIPSSNDHRIYFDYGSATLDRFYKPYQLKIDQVMRKNGFNRDNWKTLEFVGDDHSETSWSNRLDKPLLFLLGGG